MKKILTFLGIDSEASLALCQPYVKGFDVKIQLLDEKILLEGKDTQRVFEILKDIFGDKMIDSQNLAEFIIKTLEKNNQKITTAESCTGGLLAYQFTSISGASSVYDGGIVTYANAFKHKCLKVSNEHLQRYGAVSEVVVQDMLKGVLNLFEADYAIATSGVAGPGGGSVEKPVGTVFIGVQKVGNLAVVERYLFRGSREAVQKQSCLRGLEMLIRNL